MRKRARTEEQKARRRVTDRAWRAANRSTARQRHSAWIAANRERSKKTYQQWVAAHPTRRNEISAAWLQSHAERLALSRKVGSITRNAIRAGRLRRATECEQCGASGVAIEAAHSNYADPLNVRWLCIRCHREWDREDPKLSGRMTKTSDYASYHKPRMETLGISAACAGGQHWRCFGKRRSWSGWGNATCQCTCSLPMAKPRRGSVLSHVKPVPVPDQP